MYLYLSYIVFKKQMLQAANNERFNPLVPKARNSDCQNLPFPLQIRPIKLSSSKFPNFYFLRTLDTNGLSDLKCAGSGSLFTNLVQFCICSISHNKRNLMQVIFLNTLG